MSGQPIYHQTKVWWFNGRLKMGIWILGKHRLMYEDSTSIDNVEKIMVGNKTNMIFTDSSYNVK